MEQKASSEHYSPLELLKATVADELQQVNERIISLVENKLSLITDISEHTFSAGGKRLRPMLTLACSSLVGHQGTSHIALATAVEFMHTATLLHDDVVDESLMRRGIPTANERWGNKEAVLVGDFLLGKAFELMGEADSVDIYKILSNAAMVISEGEVFQLSSTANIHLSQEDYLTIIQSKTGALFAAACEVGGAVNNITAEQQKALRDYGMYLGIAFQMADDALDYATQLKNLGKNTGDDFREKKVTLPVILAYEKSNSEERQLLEQAFEPSTDNSQLFDSVAQLLGNYSTIEQSLNIARNYTKQAHEVLNKSFNDSTIKNTLLELLDFVVDRNF